MMGVMSMQSQLPEGGEAVGRTNRALAKRFLTGACVIAALTGLVYTLSSTETKVVRRYPDHLEAVNPENSSQNVPAQSSVTADLEFGYTGALIINGRELPKDQVDETVATGELRFTPGPEKEFKRLPGGATTVTVVFWPTQGTRDTDADSYQWVLNVN
jgi:hypothetical protein